MTIDCSGYVGYTSVLRSYRHCRCYGGASRSRELLLSGGSDLHTIRDSLCLLLLAECSLLEVARFLNVCSEWGAVVPVCNRFQQMFMSYDAWEGLSLASIGAYRVCACRRLCTATVLRCYYSANIVHLNHVIISPPGVLRLQPAMIGLGFLPAVIWDHLYGLQLEVCLPWCIGEYA